MIERNKKADEEILVKNIEAIHSSETDKIINRLVNSDICATSVGKGALPKVIPLIVEGIKIRKKQFLSPLDIIIAENIRNGTDYFRKLFIYNLGHAASAYLGNIKYPHKDLIAEVLEDESLKLQVRKVMTESAAALLCEYPDDFTKEALADHIDDLLFRFQNKALGDTVFRVGRDLSRKLGRDDRILGAAGLCLKHNFPFKRIIDIFYSALEFKASDQIGDSFRGDEIFLEGFAEMGISKALTDLCGLNSVKDERLIEIIMEADND